MPIKVKCRLCGKYFWQVNNSHLKKHGYTVTDYKEEYDLTYVTAPVVRQAVSQINAFTIRAS